MGFLVTLCLLAVVAALWSRVSKLQDRVRDLEARWAVDATTKAPAATAPPREAAVPASTAPPVTAPVIAPAAAPQVARPEASANAVPAAANVPPVKTIEALARQTPSPAPSGPSWQASLVDLMRKNLFAVAGIALLLLGFVVLFHSIEWGHLLSPMAKVSLAWAAAVALGVAGVRLSARNALWGQMAQGGGAAIGYLATYVASSAYELLSPTVSLALFAAISAVLVLRALKEDAKVLVAIGFLGAYAAPLLALYGHAGLLFHLSYGIVVTGFALWVSLSRRWLEIGVHAHACAAGLAALAYAASRDEPGLPAWQQQLLLTIYLVQFAGWTTTWAARHAPVAAQDHASTSTSRSTSTLAASSWWRTREIPVLCACFSLTVIVFLAMQAWLLDGNAFMAVAFVSASVLGALGARRLPAHGLRETAWVLAAFSVAAGLERGDLPETVSSLGLFAEGAILMLSTQAGSVLRRAVSRLLVIVGAIAVIGGTADAALWPVAVLVVASLALSLAMARAQRGADAKLTVAVTVLAAATLAYRCATRFAGGDEATGAVFTLVMLGTAALAYLLDRSTPDTDSTATTAATTPVSAPTAAKPSPLTVRRLYAIVLAIGWVVMLPVLPEIGRPLALTALITPVVFGVISAWRSMRRPMSPDAAEGAKVRIWVALLLPALIAYTVASPWSVVALLAVTGTAVCAWVLTRWRVVTTMPAEPHRTRLTPSLLAHASMFCAIVPLVLAADHSDTTDVWLLAAGAFYVALLTWWRLGDDVPAEARQVLVASVGVAVAYVVARGVIQAPALAFELAWRSYLLPVALAAVGVAFLFLSTRAHRRLAWQVSAVVCVMAMVKLLLSLGSWALSPMGIVGSLLGMGALFLLAGYLAPQPPARED